AGPDGGGAAAVDGPGPPALAPGWLAAASFAGGSAWVTSAASDPVAEEFIGGLAGGRGRTCRRALAGPRSPHHRKSAPDNAWRCCRGTAAGLRSPGRTDRRSGGRSP